MKKLLRALSYPEKRISFERASKNPVLLPIPEHAWEAKGVFNPGVIRDGGKTRVVYRALSNGDTSVLGYALSARWLVD